MSGGRLRRFGQYLWQKLPEVAAMGPKDALLAKLVVDIHRKRTHCSSQLVPLAALEPVHALDRPEVLAKVQERQAAVQAARPVLLAKEALRREDLMEVIPSVSGFKVVAAGEGRYVAFEGNGRLEALHRVFCSEDDIHLEVEVYHFKNNAKMLRRVRRVQRQNRVGPFA